MTATNIRLFVLMVLRGGVYGSIGPFLSVIVLREGLPLALIGPLYGVGAVLTLIGSPWWGRLGDRYGRRRMFAFTMGLVVPVVLALTVPSLPVVLVAASAWAFVAAAYVPLGDSLTLDRIGGDRAIFARMRIGASIGYMACIVAIGWLITFTPVGWAAPGLVAAVVAVAVVVLIAGRMRGELRTGRGVAWVPRPTSPEEAAALAARADARIPSSMEQARRFARFLIGMVGVFAAVNAPGVFVGPHVAELGGSGWDIGLASSAGTLMELPAYFLIAVVLARFGPRRTFALGATLQGIAGVATALAPTPELVIVARIFVGAGYSWLLVPSVAAIAAAGGPRERASLTGLHFATSAAGTLAVAVLGVPLVEVGGTTLVLVVASLLAPLGAAIALTGWPVPAPVPLPVREEARVPV